MNKLFFFFLVTLSFSILIFGEDHQEILSEVDRLASYLDTDFSAEYSIVEEKGGSRSKTVAAVFRRDSNNKYTIVITEPEVSKGQGYLKVDTTLWFYDPESRRFNFSSAKDRFQNTNARNSDFTRSTLSEDYDVVKGEKANLGKYKTWLLTLEANNDEVAYPKMKVWIDEEYLVRKTEDYSLSGQLLRTTVFPRYQKIGDRYVPYQFLFTEELENVKTQISIRKVSFKKLQDSIFSKSFLENVGS